MHSVDERIDMKTALKRAHSVVYDGSVAQSVSEKTKTREGTTRKVGW
jgi:hypothetical protein